MPASSSSSFPRDFYERRTEVVAQDLLGRLLVHELLDSTTQVGRIVEVEAYVGERDRASHASRGRTTRTSPMFEAAGHAYVYLIYGMYWCLNVVTEPAGKAMRGIDSGGRAIGGAHRSNRWARALDSRVGHRWIVQPGRFHRGFTTHHPR